MEKRKRRVGSAFNWWVLNQYFFIRIFGYSYNDYVFFIKIFFILDKPSPKYQYLFEISFFYSLSSRILKFYFWNKSKLSIVIWLFSRNFGIHFTFIKIAYTNYLANAKTFERMQFLIPTFLFENCSVRFQSRLYKTFDLLFIYLCFFLPGLWYLKYQKALIRTFHTSFLTPQ